MKSVVVIPTYNEKDNISALFDEIFKHIPETHILVVDDNSPDGTAQIVKDRKANDNRIHILEREGKMGLGTAYCAGFSWALDQKYDVVFEMDADFSHDPKDLPRMLATLNEGYDLVIGSRYIEGMNVVNWPLKRLILSYGASLYTRIISGLPVKDCTGGFKCFRAETLAKIDFDTIRTNGYGFQIEMNYRVWKNKGKIKELSIVFTDRVNGVSKMNKKIIYEAVFLVWKLRFAYKSMLKKKNK
jgi:dolichol-phosphate mannosyltransferase